MLQSVLLIDDDDVSLLLGKLMIEESGFAKEILTAGNGLKALDLLAGFSKEHKAPEAIFLDLNMPVMDGWQFLDAYEKKYAKILPGMYLAILTSTIDPKEQQRAEQHPLVDRFISKPLTLDWLRVMRESWVKIQ